MKIKNFEFEIKEVSEDGVIEGYASTFGGKPDSYGDIIAPGAFSETLLKNGRNGTGIPSLWQHDFTEPIGTQELSENKKGLKTKTQLVMEVQRAREAHALAKAGAISAFSIGWDFIRDKNGKVVEDAYEVNEKNGTKILKRIELWEVSLVTFPANTNATITGVKHIFEQAETERHLEEGLREAGLSRSAAKFIIQYLDKDRLFRDGKEKSLDNDFMSVVENSLKINNSLEDSLLKAVQNLNL